MSSYFMHFEQNICGNRHKNMRIISFFCLLSWWLKFAILCNRFKFRTFNLKSSEEKSIFLFFELFLGLKFEKHITSATGNRSWKKMFLTISAKRIVVKSLPTPVFFLFSVQVIKASEKNWSRRLSSCRQFITKGNCFSICITIRIAF